MATPQIPWFRHAFVPIIWQPLLGYTVLPFYQFYFEMPQHHVISSHAPTYIQFCLIVIWFIYIYNMYIYIYIWLYMIFNDIYISYIYVYIYDIYIWYIYIFIYIYNIYTPYYTYIYILYHLYPIIPSAFSWYISFSAGPRCCRWFLHLTWFQWSCRTRWCFHMENLKLYLGKYGIIVDNHK